jgi:hypothetical protein
VTRSIYSAENSFPGPGRVPPATRRLAAALATYTSWPDEGAEGLLVFAASTPVLDPLALALQRLTTRDGAMCYYPVSLFGCACPVTRRQGAERDRLGRGRP